MDASKNTHHLMQITLYLSALKCKRQEYGKTMSIYLFRIKKMFTDALTLSAVIKLEQSYKAGSIFRQSQALLLHSTCFTS